MLTPYNLVVLIIGMSFLLGMATFTAGILILALRASSSEVRTLAIQATRLAQKGIADDIAGLVGNASDLLDSMNQLVLTIRGVGLFLTFLGLLLMGGSCWAALKLIQSNL
jgi:hypothetical protein